MHKVCENIKGIEKEIGNKSQIIIVSKYRAIERLQELYACGYRIFGENRVQALLERVEKMPKNVQWHLIGHLQKNKVKYIAPFIAMIHSVDSYELMLEINKRALAHDRVIDVLLQVHIAQEESKFGFVRNRLSELFENENWQDLKNIRICGLMGMATNTDNKNLIRQEFLGLRDLFMLLKNKYFVDSTFFKHLSMGMTNDYLIAIDCGSTLLRIGSKIFEND